MRDPFRGAGLTRRSAVAALAASIAGHAAAGPAPWMRTNLRPFAPGIYNVSQATLPNLTAALKSFKAGLSSPIIGYVGDSTEFGIGAGYPTDAGGNYAHAHSNSSAVQTAALLNTAGIAANGQDNIWGIGNNTMANYLLAEPNFTVSGSGWAGSPYPSVAGAGFYNSTDTTSTFTFQTYQSCDTLDLFIAKVSGACSIVYSIDGGAFSAPIQCGGTIALSKVTIALGASATHTVTVKVNVNSPILQGFRFRDTTTPRILIENAGWPSAHISNIAQASGIAAAFSSGAVYNQIGFSAAFLQLGQVNDEVSDFSPQLFAVQMAAMAQGYRQSGCDPILVVSHPTGDRTSPSFRNAIRALAVRLACPLLDIQDLYPKTTDWTGASLNWDTLHPDGAGYGVIAGLRAQLIEAAYGWS